MAPSAARTHAAAVVAPRAPATAEVDTGEAHGASREVWLVLAAATLFSVVLAYLLGQDHSWDLQNYHLYNPHAWLEGRLFRDIQPAMRQTYFNPLLDVPFYLLATSLSPLAASLILAAFQGLLLPLAWLVARRLLRDVGTPPGATAALAFALALAGVLSPLAVYELGLTAGDNTTAVLVLAGVVVLLRVVPRVGGAAPGARDAALTGVAAGLLVGAAVGLKLTNAPYAVALAAALWLAGTPARPALAATGGYALGGLLGVAATAGFWWYTLYAELGNPLFPQLNHVFRSPWIYAEPFTDDTFKGDGLLARLFYPFVYNELTGGRIGFKRFMDARLPVLYLLVVAWGLAAAWRRLRHRSAPTRRAASRAHAFLAWFVVVAYVLWLVVFSIDRYVLLLEVLAPVAAVALLVLVGLRGRGLALATGAVLVLFAATYHSVPPQRRDWSARLFDVELADPAAYANALVLMAGEQPLAFHVPAFPRTTRFVRLDGNLFYGPAYGELDARYDNETGRAIARAIAGHRGPLYVMVHPRELERARPVLHHFGVALDSAPPRPLASSVYAWQPLHLHRARSDDTIR